MDHATAERGACLKSLDRRTSLLESRAPPMGLPSGGKGLGDPTLACRTNDAEGLARRDRHIAEQMCS